MLNQMQLAILPFTWKLILEYINIINYEKHLVTFLIFFGGGERYKQAKEQICHLSIQCKELTLGVLTFMLSISSLSCYQHYSPRQRNSIPTVFAFVKKITTSFIPTNAIF